jgi:hypothetical protein
VTAHPPILACGCEANATRTLADGTKVPSCVIHMVDTPMKTPPDLTGRTARCTCGETRPSDGPRLAFFEYLGAGTYEATELCKTCGYHTDAHHDRPCQVCGGSGQCTITATRGPNAGTSTTHRCNRCRGTGVWAKPSHACDAFVPRGDPGHDRYYCGHAGWD